ncbi:amidohydrolase [Kribbella capetownensis]|uniref:Amidohydrolase n=1 Tax=Kribbella capetownensis TaxID=1572659 RepID=A0A4R0JR90_9ACTN|nr:amidohydrolase family protein [Kribbella capetownensis]TCC47528.1 amidohydrolase [Kribbella capetownensis]
MTIVDAHCHVGKGDTLTGPWDVGRLDHYLRRADAAGITQTVLFSVFHGDYLTANRAVAKVVASRPERFIGFAFVHPARDAGRVAELVHEAVYQLGFRGLKVHRHDAALTPEIARAADRFGLPVLYDPMGQVAPLELFATEFPRVAFIVPHLGSFADDWAAQRAVIDLLVRLPNVYADTSGVRRFDLLVEAVRRAGPEKLIFGSDGPWLHPGLELAKIKALGLSRRDEQAVLGGTLLELLSPLGAGQPAAVGARAR